MGSEKSGGMAAAGREIRRPVIRSRDSMDRIRVEAPVVNAGVMLRQPALMVRIASVPPDRFLDPSHGLGRNMTEGFDYVGGNEGDEPATDGGIRPVQTRP